MFPTSTESVSTESVGRRLLNEHRAIRTAMQVIHEWLGRVNDGEPDCETTGQVLEGLDSLSRQLVEHFAREEAPDGVFARAQAQAPRLERHVLALRRQHGPLRAEFRQLMADAGYAGLAPDAWRGVAKKFDAFAETLRDHEHAEDHILSDAYLNDLGGGD